MPVLRFTFIVLLIQGISGCVAYRPQPISPQASARAFSSRSLTGEETRAALVQSGLHQSWPPAQWDFKMLKTVALQMHPDAVLAHSKFESAQAGIRTAGERPNPTVSIAPQFVTPMKWMLGTYGVDFDIPIETGGKRSSRLVLAKAQVASAGFHVAEVAWTIRSRVRKAMLALSHASHRADLLGEAVKSQDEIIKFMEQRAEAGEASRPEITQSRLLLNQFRLQLADAERQQNESRADVAAAVGMSVNALDGETLDFSEFERVPTARNVSAACRDALQHRADVLTALSEYAVSEATLRGEVAKQYPDIHLGPGYQWDAGVNKWNAGLGFTLPILNQNRGAIGEASARRNEAAARFESVQAGVLGEVEHAQAGQLGASSKYATAEELVAVQDKILLSAKTLTQSGESDRLSVISAQLEYTATALARLDALVELQTAFGQLEDALQTPLD